MKDVQEITVWNIAQASLNRYSPRWQIETPNYTFIISESNSPDPHPVLLTRTSTNNDPHTLFQSYPSLIQALQIVLNDLNNIPTTLQKTQPMTDI